jgi:phage baseplate assembly protein W
MYSRLGIDLALTSGHGPEGRSPLSEADSWHGLDLATGPARRAGRPRDEGLDLQAVAGRENLAQALILRLLTPLGGLAHLGHPAFGSRLGELVGRLNDAPTRNLARLYTLQALAREPRVAAVEELTVSVPIETPEVVAIGFKVRPVGDEDPVAVAVEVAL